MVSSYWKEQRLSNCDDEVSDPPLAAALSLSAAPSDLFRLGGFGALGLAQEIVLLELPQRHPPLEHDVQLLIGPVRALREAEEAPYKADQANTPKEEASLATPVGLVAVQHVRNRDGGNDGEQGLDGSGDGDRLVPETRGGDLGDDDEADRSDRQLVREGPDVHERGHRPYSRLVVCGKAEESNNEEQNRHKDHAAIIDRSAAETKLCTPRQPAMREVGVIGQDLRKPSVAKRERFRRNP